DGQGALVHLQRQLRAAREVEALVDVDVAAEQVGRQRHGLRPGQRVVVDDSVDVARAVDDQREEQQADDDDADGPAQYEIQGSRSVARWPANVARRGVQLRVGMAATNHTTAAWVASYRRGCCTGPPGGRVKPR